MKTEIQARCPECNQMVNIDFIEGKFGHNSRYRVEFELHDREDADEKGMVRCLGSRSQISDLCSHCKMLVGVSGENIVDHYSGPNNTDLCPGSGKKKYDLVDYKTLMEIMR